MATCLAKLLEQYGHKIDCIVNPNHSGAEKLANQLYQAHFSDIYDLTDLKSDFILIAVPDLNISNVISQYSFPEKAIILHTSGNIGLNVFPKNWNAGILYPIQTFVKGYEINYDIPFLVNGTNATVLKKVKVLAKSISNIVVDSLSDDQKKHLHLAAVFGSNFINHIVRISKDICKENNIPSELLQGLIVQSVENILNENDINSLTGPAKRKDFNVLKSQNALLEERPALQNIYQAITDDILSKNTYK